MKFELPKENSSIIKVIGVGGGGSNAVNHMFQQGIKGVDFIVCNTDKQALDISPVTYKIALGSSLTEGLGAGSIPEVGRNSAIESIEDVRALLAQNTKMVFITAGMGGGTGTGAAPVIAKIAKEMGILTVAIVTIPFAFEGKKRKMQAEQGLEELRKCVDTLLVISNDKLREIYGNLKVGEAFGKADDVLTTAAKGIADIITTTLHINTDFADITTVMKDSGVAIMGSAQASGEGRAVKAVEAAMTSPLLNDSNIKGARYVLVNITCGSGVNEISMDELGEITDYIQESAGMSADVIKGYGVDENLGDQVSVTIIATGFNSKADLGTEIQEKPKRIVHDLLKAPVHQPMPDNTTAVRSAEPEFKSVPVVETKVSTPVAETFTVSESPLAAAPLNIVPVVTDVPMFTQVEFISMPVEESNVAPVVAETTENVLGNAIDETSIVAEEEVFVDVIETPVAEVQKPFVNNELFETPVAEEQTETPIATIETLVSAIEQTIVANQNIEETPIAEVEVNSFVAEVEEPIVNETEITSEVKEETEEPFLIVRNPEDKQVTFEFEVTNTPVAETPSTPVSGINASAETPAAVEAKNDEKVIISIQNDDMMRKAQERINKLKEMSYKVKSPSGIHEMENEPAYKRRNVQLGNVPHSSESTVSRYTLSEGEDNKVEIKANNSFLHDNVD